MRAVVVGVLALLLALPAAGDAMTVPGAKPPPAKTKKVCKTKKVKGKKKRVCVKKKVPAKKKPAPAQGAPAPTQPAPAQPGPAQPTAPAPGAPAAPKGETTRDDEAGRQLVSQDLLLEKFEGGNVSYTYYRVFLYANGSFKYSIVDYTQPSGEICRSEGSFSGQWTFKEGYRIKTADGRTGRAVVITTPKGDEVFAALDGDDRHVYVGRNEVQFERNPNMRDQC